MAEDKTDTKKSSWNFSADHSKLIFQRLNISQIAQSQGNTKGCFESLKQIFELIEFNMTDKEVKKLDHLIFKVERMQRYWDRFNKLSRDGQITKWTRIEEKRRQFFIYGVKILQRKVLRCLLKTGLIKNQSDDTDVDM